MNRTQRPSRRATRRAIGALIQNGNASLQRTASQFGISARSLQRYLAEMGTSHSELVAEVRIKKACHLLVKSNERIGDIAGRLGFANASSFSRTFMRLTEMQPRVFRAHQMIGARNQSVSRKLLRRGRSPSGLE